MSKKMDDSELQNLIDSNLDYCKNTLKEFSESSIDKVRKKAMLVAYWLKDYFRMFRCQRPGAGSRRRSGRRSARRPR